MPSTVTPNSAQNRAGSSSTPRQKLPSLSLLGSTAKTAAVSVMKVVSPKARGRLRSARAGRASRQQVAPHSTRIGI